MKIEKFGRQTIVVLATLLFAFLTVTSFVFTAYFDFSYLEHTLYKWDSPVFHLVFLAVVFLVLFWISKKGWLESWNPKMVSAVLVLYVALVSGIWAVISHAVPTADQYKVCECAADFIQGNYYNLNPGKYLQICPQQLGYVFFLELVFRIFGAHNYNAVEAINVIFICLEFYMIYKITDKLFRNRKVTNLVLLVSFGCFPYFFFSTMVYGEMLATPLTLCAVYFLLGFVENGKKRDAVLTAVLLGLSVLLKQNCWISVIAVCLFLLVKAWSKKKAGYLLVILLSILCVCSFQEVIKKQYELRSGYEMQEGASPAMYVAMGMQESDMAEGWYNGYILGSFWANDEDFGKSHQKAMEDIKASLKNFSDNPAYALRFYYRKIVSQWNNPTYECLWISHFENSHDADLSTVVQSLYVGKAHVLFTAFTNGYQLLLFLTALVGLLWQRKKFTLEQLLPAVIVLGGFFFHILWEAKTRYILPYYVLIIPYAAVGIGSILELIHQRKKSGKIAK